MGWISDLKTRWKEVAAEYGKVAIITYFTIFFSVWGGFAVAISLGFEVESAGAGMGTIAASYIACKFTQPIRIAATIGLTPVVARVLRRLSPPAQELSPPTREE